MNNESRDDFESKDEVWEQMSCRPHISQAYISDYGAMVVLEHIYAWEDDDNFPIPSWQIWTCLRRDYDMEGTQICFGDDDYCTTIYDTFKTEDKELFYMGFSFQGVYSNSIPAGNIPDVWPVLLTETNYDYTILNYSWSQQKFLDKVKLKVDGYDYQVIKRNCGESEEDCKGLWELRFQASWRCLEDKFDLENPDYEAWWKEPWGECSSLQWSERYTELSGILPPNEPYVITVYWDNWIIPIIVSVAIPGVLFIVLIWLLKSCFTEKILTVNDINNGDKNQSAAIKRLITNSNVELKQPMSPQEEPVKSLQDEPVQSPQEQPVESPQEQPVASSKVKSDSTEYSYLYDSEYGYYSD